MYNYVNTYMYMCIFKNKYLYVHIYIYIYTSSPRNHEKRRLYVATMFFWIVTICNTKTRF